MDNPKILSSVTPNKTKLALWLSKKYDTEVLENELYMTNGNINSIQLLMDVFMESGDEIIVEEPICENLKKDSLLRNFMDIL
jgi:DNA-binding transcriptional MocR family regulator